MEAALVGGLLKAILPKLFSLAEEKYMLRKGVKNDITSLTKELDMIVAAINDELSEQIEDHRAVPRLSIEDLRELAHSIEDCIDNFMYRTAWKQRMSSIGRSIRFPKTVSGDLRLANEVQQLLKSAVETKQRHERYTVPGRRPPAPAAASWPVSDPRILHTDLVGLDGPREKLLQQLVKVNGRPKELKVLAIVGFCGLGKTALAAQVYNNTVASFEKHAWVRAAHRPPAEVLTDLLQKLAPAAGSSHGISDIGQLCVDLREELDKKRYFIVIDDIRTKDQWDSIKLVLPPGDITSKILVTTTIQSLANVCTSDNDGYVHKLSRLDEECSKELFFKKACPVHKLCYEQPDSTEILKKCDGQPLALVAIGGFLRRKGWPTEPNCEDLCSQLHYHLENDETLEEMRRVLTRNYTALPSHALKTCLLYFGTFPRDHPIRKKCLLRRWLAEGFVEAQCTQTTPDPANYFDMLVDRNIIEPVNVSNNEKVKTCQTYGMMHECILHMAIAQNFVTLFSNESIQPRYVRRLSLHNNTVINDDNLDGIDLSLVRSLTISGKATEAILDFSKYRLLRVLDMEKCDGLTDDHLKKKLSSLLLLKYLSLGGNITKLPRDIGKLSDLEVLDLRRTKVNILPAEVFQIPCLVHLFGKFKLPDRVKTKSEVLAFLSKGKSNLQTIAGFVFDGRQSFLHLIDCIKKLRKLKIWLEPSAGADSHSLTNLQEAIQQFIKDRNEANIGPRSLSLDFDKCSEDFLNSLEEPCHLSSLKLKGKLSALPEFIISLRGLKELCLESAKLPKGLLEDLSKLGSLKYLKLVADELEKIIIKVNEFPNLRCLCFVLQQPTFPTFEQGSMRFLVTLQLLCKDLNGLSDIKIEIFKDLKEVVLDRRVARDTKDEWERAAKEHPRRPNVLLAKMIDAVERDLTEDSITLEKDTLECIKDAAEREFTEDSTTLRRDTLEGTEDAVEKELTKDSITLEQDTLEGIEDAEERELIEDSIAFERDMRVGTEIVVASNRTEIESHMLVDQGLDSSAATQKQKSLVVQSSSDDAPSSSSSIMQISMMHQIHLPVLWGHCPPWRRCLGGLLEGWQLFRGAHLITILVVIYIFYRVFEGWSFYGIL